MRKKEQNAIKMTESEREKKRKRKRRNKEKQRRQGREGRDRKEIEKRENTVCSRLERERRKIAVFNLQTLERILGLSV